MKLTPDEIYFSLSISLVYVRNSTALLCPDRKPYIINKSPEEQPHHKCHIIGHLLPYIENKIMLKHVKMQK